MVVLLHRRNMKPLQQFYFNMQMFLFPAMEEEIGKLTAKMREFVMLVELLKPGRFIPDALLGGVLGRPRRSRERLLRAFLLKAVYNFPTTDMLVENLRTSPRLRRLCGWDFACEIPSRATFCRAFGEFAAAGLGERLHEAMVAENYKDKIVGHASHDSTEIDGRERACRRKAPKSPAKRKRGRPRKAEKTSSAVADNKGKRVELQPQRTLAENLADLPRGCDWGGKRDSKGKTNYWLGYKLHLTVADGGVPVAAVMTSASLHDSQAAIPLMQMAAERVTGLYDLADAAYDCKEIREFSESLGHVPLIDRNARGGEAGPFAPAEKIRYRERSAVERCNSELKDNYGARNVRVRGHLKVFLHLMLGVVALTSKALFNMLC